MTTHIRRRRRPGKGKIAVPKDRVTLPATGWDMGAAGPANRIGLAVEDAPDLDDEGNEINPNGRKRARRVDMLEVWHRKGILSAAAFTVACDLRNAFEATQMGPSVDLAQERVDSSPKPDHAVAIQVDRLSRYHAIWRHVARGDVAILTAVVLNGGGPGDVRAADGSRPFLNGPGDVSRHDAGLRALSKALERLAKKIGA